MERDHTNDMRIRVRDSATRTLNRLTAVVAFGAIAGVAVLGVAGSYTVSGTTSSALGATASTSTTSGTTSNALQSSSTSVGSSSSTGVAVSGGS